MTEKQLMDAVVDAAKQLSTLQDALADYCLRTNKESLTVAEPASQWIPVSERLLDAYAQISKGAERMGNRDCKHGQLARSCDIRELEGADGKDETIAALERENAELREALIAIKARINGEFDHPALLKHGALVGLRDDVERIIGSVLDTPTVTNTSSCPECGGNVAALASPADGITGTEQCVNGGTCGAGGFCDECVISPDSRQLDIEDQIGGGE